MKKLNNSSPDKIDKKNTKTILGSDLIGITYKPLFPYFNKSKSFVVLDGDFVNDQDGTGIVHIAPGFGEDDFLLCKKSNIATVCPVDDSGCFDSQIYDLEYNLGGSCKKLSLSGVQVFDGNDDIIKYLKGCNVWLKTKEYVHDYPYCWRTDTPLIYKAMKSWYVKVSDLKDRMVELNKQINWIPDFVKDSVFGKWLENTRDWSISRNRFWGCPIPIWRSDNDKYPRIDVYGSIQEMKQDFGDYYRKVNGIELKIKDLHRPFVDSLVRPNPDDPTGKSMMVRVEDVLDCWFESGSMPFAQTHYPFGYNKGNIKRSSEENQDWFHENYPADFVVEYMAQTRGWFYTLMVISTAIFDQIPFKNCICHGVVLDESGKKLSKRSKNYPDPMLMLKRYGSDAMRFAMLRSGVMRGREMNIDKEGRFISNASKAALSPIWNAFSFLRLYMKADGLDSIKNKEEQLMNFNSQRVIDKYIISKLNDFIVEMKSSMDSYNTMTACKAIESFVEIMNNWYIRRSRKRFWSSIKITGSRFDSKMTLIENLKKSDKKTLSKLAQYSIENTISDQNNEYEKYIDSAIADVILDSSRDWRLQIDDKNKMIIVIDRDKQDAYNTLYSVLMTFITAIAPVLPCLSEKIYLELIK